MIGSTLTESNLKEIKKAMDKIKSIDQSDYFKSYYGEVVNRLKVIERSKKYMEQCDGRSITKA